MSNYTGHGSYEGEITINGYDYYVDFKYKVHGYYDPGCAYLRNGDPGYPPDEEILDVEVEWESCEPAEEDAPAVSNADVDEAVEAKAWELAEDGAFECDER